MECNSTFDHVIVTAPSLPQSQVYTTLCAAIKNRLDTFKNTTFYCVHDPLNARVGSGGGTLNAIDFLVQKFGSSLLESKRILIIHSGGDSRRSPLHSVCGKAWASLNALCDKILATPLVFLLMEFNAFFVNLPKGSIVVASSDVLLDIVKSNISSDRPFFPSNAITVVAVNESAHIAASHGVLVKSIDVVDTTMSYSNGGAANEGTRYHLVKAANYLQKPSMSEMESSGAILHPCNVRSQIARTSSNMSLKPVAQALIDTGFATKALINMVVEHGVLKFCTITGLKDLQGKSGDDIAPVALRLELYSEMLNACALASGPPSFTEYCSRLKYFPSSAMSDAEALYHKGIERLWTLLKNISLYILHVDGGMFGHLGTSLEFLELVCTSRRSYDGVDDETRLKNAKFAKKYNFSNLVQTSIVLGSKSSSIHSEALSNFSGVSIMSIFCLESVSCSQMSSNSICSLVEHSVLSSTFDLSQNVIVSHVIDKHLSNNLAVGNDTMVQQVPLLLHYVDPSHNCPIPKECWSVLIVLGIRDDVKAHYKSSKAKVCGASWSILLNAISLCMETPGGRNDVEGAVDFVWPNTAESDKSLWNAKLFMSWSSTSQLGPEKLMTSLWLQSLSTSLSSKEFLNSQFKTWINTPGFDGTLCRLSSEVPRRYSLSDLLKCGDASAMHSLRSYIANVANIMPTNEGYPIHGNSVSITSTLISDVYCHCRLAQSTIESLVKHHISNSPDTLDSASVCDVTEIAAAILYSVWAARLCSNSSQNSECSNTMRKVAELCLETVDGIRSLSLLDQVIDSFHIMYSRISTVISYGNAALVDFSVKSSLCSQFFLGLIGPLRSVHTINILSRLLFDDAQTSIPFESYPRLLLILAHISRRARLTVDAGIARDLIRKFALGADVYSIKLKCCILSIDSTQISVDDCDGKVSLEIIFEKLSCLITAAQVQSSIVPGDLNKPSMSVAPDQCTINCNRNCVVVSEAPARIDLTGGWSDTPPICYELSGSVFNVAVQVDGLKPLSSACRFIERPVIILRSYRILNKQEPDRKRLKVFDGSSSSTNQTTAVPMFDFECDTVELSHRNDLADVEDSLKPCALLKAVFIVLGLFNKDVEHFEGILIQRYCGGIEVGCVSALPAGSGMGGSSILAATVLASVSQLLSLPTSKEQLVYQVLQVEQILTTGGGWQDQVGGIFPGFKIARSESSLPLRVSICTIDKISTAVIDSLHSRMHLVFTGQQRLAKNTLINALRKYATAATGDGWGNIIAALVKEAEDAVNLCNKAITGQNEIESFIDNLGELIDRYWDLKRAMAEGSEPQHISRLLALLRPHCVGLALCGAGAGGFLVIIRKRESTAIDVRNALITYVEQQSPRNLAEDHSLTIVNPTLHEARVDEEGLVLKVIETASEILDLSKYFFQRKSLKFE